ncbi:hypothetical protein ACPA9J_00580 [Pseudomonas aeruginosa]
MPGTGNFVGEFLILFGSHQSGPGDHRDLAPSVWYSPRVYSLSMLHRAYFGKAKTRNAAKDPAVDARVNCLSSCCWRSLLVLLGLLPAADPGHLACQR